MEEKQLMYSAFLELDFILKISEKNTKHLQLPQASMMPEMQRTEIIFTT